MAVAKSCDMVLMVLDAEKVLTLSLGGSLKKITLSRERKSRTQT